MASESEPIRARGIIVKNMTRDVSTLAAPVLPTGPGIRVYLFGRIPRAVCLEISTSPSIEVCMAHAILTSVPGYVKKYVKNFISLLF